MSYPWIKDGQYVTSAATGYLAVTSPNGLHLTDGASVSSNMASNNGYARLDLTSGNLTTTPPRAVLQAYVDYTASPAYGESLNKLDLGTSTGNDIEIINGDAPAELPENMIKLHTESAYNSNYIQLRSAFDYIGLESVLNLGIDTFTLTIANQLALTIANSSTDPVVFRRNLSTTTRTADGNPVGMLENSVINATTTGTTTLTVANAFATIVNTPTIAGRIFVLPAPTAGSAGFWYAICNKSTDFTINVQQPLGTTIASIPVASATNGGSVARFAVTAGGTSYFAVDSSDRAITANEVKILLDGTTNTDFPITFANAVGNSQQLSADTTSGTGLFYNPSTETVKSTNFATGVSSTIGSSLSTTALVIRNSPSFTTTVNSNQITCTQNSPLFTTTITPTSVTSTTFTGALSGNATTATTATTATNATNVGVTSDNTSGIYYLTFVKTSGSANKPLFIDDRTGPLTYNPSTSAFSVGTTLKLEASATGRVAIGAGAGTTVNGTGTIAIGANAGLGTTLGQGTNAIAIGNNAATTSQGSESIAIGNAAGLTTQGIGAIAIGSNAGRGSISSQGANAIAIGTGAGQTSQTAGSICLNASGASLATSTAGCYINPIRNATQTNVIGYDTTTKEMSYYITGSIANFNGTPTGGTITTFFENGIQYRAHTFTSGSSSFQIPGGINSPTIIDLLIVGGGGSGGNSNTVSGFNSPGGGGGAGQVLVLYEILLNTTGSTVSFTTSVGAGGVNNSGTSSTFLIPSPIAYNGTSLTITAGGGGKGGNAGVAGTAGVAGFNELSTQTAGTSTTTTFGTNGSGGGGGGDDNNDRSGGNGGFAAESFSRTSGKWFGGGFNGGAGGNNISGGGGGGAQESGRASSDASGGTGGIGIAIDFDGTYRLIGGGGGGGGTSNGGNTGGVAGGRYGGGIGGNGTTPTAPTAGTANTGGGGGGSRPGTLNQFLGADGGSGLIIVRYTI